MYELIQLKRAFKTCIIDFGTQNQQEVLTHDKIPEIDAKYVPLNLKLNLNVLFKK